MKMVELGFSSISCIKTFLLYLYNMNKLPSFFIRRYDSHKFEKVMKRAAIHAYWDTKTKDAFMVELIKSSVDAFFNIKYNISVDNLSEEDWTSIIDYLIDVFKPLMELYYRNLKRDYPMG